MIKKILIANRGEIALRILRTCRELDIEAVAIYSELDEKSPHVIYADEAYPLGGKTSQESYLQWQKIIDIALTANADAIHPGYGFLSENAIFAEEVEKAGLIFIGPSAKAIRMMGNKTTARMLMQKSNVPTIPGTQEGISDENEAKQIAERIGYPILLKAAAGGGGKGMRAVYDPKKFDEALEMAAREAQSSFGDATVYIEKLIEKPRHIEFQVLADKQGNTIHLGERECSIQRRHQKVVEEAPSSILTAKLRDEMGQAAINAAKACGYYNAGTIEFIVDQDQNFYFLEMNTRLQVEHPVTELVTGVDLVEEQIRIADGAPLSLEQKDVKLNGHAFECRLYAEDPQNNWAPSPGKVDFLQPASGPGVREDSAIIMGSEITAYYDPLISKLCVWGTDRKHALKRMQRALYEYQIAGIKTSLPFLQSVFKNRAFISGDFNTGFIEEHKDTLFAPPEELIEIAAVSALLIHKIEKSKPTFFEVNRNNKSRSNWKVQHLRNSMGG